MSDSSVISFPRVVVELSDPTPAQNKDEGYVEGTIWVNKNTSKIFTLVDRDVGKWLTVMATDPLGGGSLTFGVGGGGMTFGDGSDQAAHFDLGDGDFTVDADNLDLDSDGNPQFSGNTITLNKNYTSGTNPPSADLRVMRGDFDGSHMKWQEGINAWLGGTWSTSPGENRLYPLVNTVTNFSRDPLPTDNHDSGFHIGQHWINTSTNKLFVCSSCPAQAGIDAIWREILTDAAPETDRVVHSSSFVLYDTDDRRYSEISWNNMMQFVIDAVGGFGPATMGFGWQTDANDNVAPSNEMPIDNGLFEDDGSGDLMPLESPETDADVYFELDGNDDITLQAA